MKLKLILLILTVCLTAGISKAEYSYATETLRRSLPDHWLYTPEHVQTSPVDDAWWKEFNDTTLDMLISKAIDNNFNVSAALKRLDIARRQVEEVRSGYYPVVGASAGYSISQDAGALNNPRTSSHHSSSFSLGANMNWEIDLFGKVRDQVKAAKAGVRVSHADYEGVMVSMCATLAKAYVTLRCLQEQYAVAMTHIASQKHILRITEARLEAGIGNSLEVAQAKVVLYSTNAAVPGIEAKIRVTANSIAILIGAYPAEVVPQLLIPDHLPKDFGMPAIGLPADLIRRRPDVVQAEAQMAQYAAQIGVAKKDFLPTLNISGSIGTYAHKGGDLFGRHSLGYSVTPTLSWTIFDGMARSNRLAEARLQMEESIDNYNLVVLTAIEEVQNAVANYNSSLQECDLLEKLVVQSKKALDLSVDLYRSGLSSFTNVMDAQQSYLSNQNSLVESRGQVLSELVALYQALGGGF